MNHSWPKGGLSDSAIIAVPLSLLEKTSSEFLDVLDYKLAPMPSIDCRQCKVCRNPFCDKKDISTPLLLWSPSSRFRGPGTWHPHRFSHLPTFASIFVFHFPSCLLCRALTPDSRLSFPGSHCCLIVIYQHKTGQTSGDLTWDTRLRKVIDWFSLCLVPKVRYIYMLVKWSCWKQYKHYTQIVIYTPNCFA